MAGVVIKFRRAPDIDNLQDTLYDGEPIFGTANHIGLGVSYGGELYKQLAVDKTLGRYYLPYDYTLTSKKTSGTINRMNIDWRFPNIMIFSNHSGSLQPMIIGSDGQYVRLGPDAMDNRGAASTLESFACGINNVSYSVTPSNSKKAYSYGNLYFDTADTTAVDTTVKVRNLDDDSMSTWVRNSGTVPATHFFKQGRFTFAKNSSRRMILDSSVKSFMYHPNAAKMKLTFYMLFQAEKTNTIFTTKIGVGDSYNLFQTTILAENNDSLLGAIAFHYDPEKMSETDLNSGNPLTIEWVRDVSMYGTTPLSTVRGLSISMLSVMYGHIPVEYINPAFDHASRENSHAKLYSTGVQSEILLNRNLNYVNFRTPLISDNYDLDITSSYNISVLNKTRAGFKYQCLSLPVGSTSGFTYAARVNGT